jgi:hypothetical protein
VEEGNAGWVFHPDDMEGIKKGLEAVLLNRSGGAVPGPPRPGFVEQFRYDLLARKLAEVFDKVHEGNR